MEIARELALGLPQGSVLVEPEALKPYECDGLSAYRATPLVAAIPTNEEEVAAVLRGIEQKSTMYQGDDPCNGQTGTAPCSRVLVFTAHATYKP